MNFLKPLRFFSITGLGTLLSIQTVSSWFKAISNAYCEPGAMQGVSWGYHNDWDDDPVRSASLKVGGWTGMFPVL